MGHLCKVKPIIIISAFFPVMYMSSAEISFSGQKREVISVTPEKSSGLDALFVAFNSSEISELKIASNNKLDVEIFSNLGGGFSQPLSTEYSDGYTIVKSPNGDCGYIIHDGDRPYYIWIVDYSQHYFRLNDLHLSETQECDRTNLTVDGDGSAITYYSIDGRPCELSREINLVYDNLEWADSQFALKKISSTLSHLSTPLSITPPLYCATEIHVSGDVFLQKWGLGVEASTYASLPNGVAVHASAEQLNLPVDDELGSNVINVDVAGLGGSAPADIRFSAEVTDGVIHNEWQIASDESFDNLLFRFNEREIDFSFEEEGIYYARFIGSNSDGSCSSFSETFDITIGASDLRIPNAFSPNGDGVNDIWKVGYRSLLSFNCWIFDRYGNELYHFSDPTDGWDGKYRGKSVKSGVYYYVIEARGADGKSYKKSGDINIIDYKRLGTSSVE